jgi:hypothetical protein
MTKNLIKFMVDLAQHQASLTRKRIRQLMIKRLMILWTLIEI